MNIESFLMQNVASAEEEKEIKLSRFPEPFVLVSITEKENDGLKKSATSKRISKSGNRVSDLNTEKYADTLLARCVKVPDLQNAKLQESYGTVGDAAATLKAMLTAGEYANVSKAVLELNGFDENDEDELKEEVKN